MLTVSCHELRTIIRDVGNAARVEPLLRDDRMEENTIHSARARFDHGSGVANALAAAVASNDRRSGVRFNIRGSVVIFSVSPVFLCKSTSKAKKFLYAPMSPASNAGAKAITVTIVLLRHVRTAWITSPLRGASKRVATFIGPVKVTV